MSTRRRPKTAGFSLVEMLAVLVIGLTIVSLILVRNREFTDELLLSNLAYDVALSVRQTQVLGLGARETDIGSEEFDLPYGIAFSESTPGGYSIFVDTNDDNICYGASLPGVTADCSSVETFSLARGASIDDVCVYDEIGTGNWPDGRCWGDSGLGNVNIIFRRPNPDPLIFTGNGAAQYSSVVVRTESNDGKARAITVTQTGQISVDVAEPDDGPYGNAWRLDVAVAGAGEGRIYESPGNLIDCPDVDCSHGFPKDSSVTLIAEALNGSTFDSWSGDCAGQSSTCVLTMDEAKDTTANFNEPSHYTVNVAFTGDGTGTVNSVPAGISCPGDCTELVPNGDTFTLTANPDTTTTFVGWSGDCSGTGSCILAMDGNKSVTANFNTCVLTVDVVNGGVGIGIVQSDDTPPLMIDCPGDCTQNFTCSGGQPVTLTPIAQGEFTTFIWWQGDDCVGNGGGCAPVMNYDKTVQAIFDTPLTYDLNVTLSGTGSGSVSSDPTGVSCPTDCTNPFPQSSVVTLTANSDIGSEFVGWSGGGCSGKSTTCDVTMDAAKVVDAQFDTSTGTQYNLTVGFFGGGTGSIISSSPAGINCISPSTPPCDANFDEDEVIWLQANGNQNNTFTSWHPFFDCTGSTNPYPVLMDSNKTCYAQFSGTGE